MSGKLESEIAKRSMIHLISNPKTAATGAQAFKGYMMRQGLDGGLEGSVEALQEGVNMAYPRCCWW